YLHTQVSSFRTRFGQESFSDRSQEAQQLISGFTCFFALAFLNDVVLLCSQVYQRTATFSEGFLSQQHTANVRVNDDRVSRFFRSFRTSQGTHCQTVFGISQSALERSFSSGRTLQSSTDT